MRYLVRILRVFGLLLISFLACHWDDPCWKVDCGDGNPCTRDYCVAECSAPDCRHEPVANGTGCSLGGASGVCFGGVCDLCVGVVCEDDGNPCTKDVCHPRTGRCGVPAPAGTVCNYKGLFPGVCAFGFCAKSLCEDGTCDDGNECTDDVCDPLARRCSYIPLENYTGCDLDGLSGVCLDGLCGEDLCEGVACDDQNPCTDDTCDYVDGSCVYTPNQPNGMPCASGELEGVCVNGVCGENLCEGVECDDGDACIEDTCDYVDGSCVHTALGDGAPCTLDGLSGHCASGVCLVDCGRVPDGTPCGDDAGTCQDGSCEVACTEQGIRDAIAAGGGPYTFDCGGLQSVVIWTTVVIDKDVVLDGESELIIDGVEESGGVVAVEAGVTAELRGVTVTGGRYGEWGGIFNQGTLTVIDSTVSGNTATYGGGIRNEGTLTLTRSTVSGNEALHGAGIYNFGTLVATNVTLSSNRTPTPNNFDSGAAVRNQGVMTMTSSTVSGNSAQHGGDVAQYDHVPAVITNTLIDGTCYLFNGRTITSAGHNVESTGDTCGFGQATDRVGVSTDNLALGPLRDNGGPTWTHALGAGSVAIDVIPEAECVDAEGEPLTTDQRGFPRDSMCDVGAFEVRP